jgi:hypothetical protein
MKLLVNGCSFTGGHDVIHNEDGILAPPPDYVWPMQCGEEHVNLAIGGNSNDKIIRTTLEHLETNNNYDGIIIQWTALYRLERYIEQYNVWGNLCKYSHEHLYDIHFDRREEDHDDRVNNLDKLLTSASHNYIWLNSDVDYKVKFLKDIIIMQHALDKINIPYLFTSMTRYDHFKKLKFETDYENTLAKQIDESKWNDNALTHICFRDVDETLHPTEYGHKKIARSLMMDFMRQL